MLHAAANPITRRRISYQVVISWNVNCMACISLCLLLLHAVVSTLWLTHTCKPLLRANWFDIILEGALFAWTAKSVPNGFGHCYSCEFPHSRATMRGNGGLQWRTAGEDVSQKLPRATRVTSAGYGACANWTFEVVCVYVALFYWPEGQNDQKRGLRLPWNLL